MSLFQTVRTDLTTALKAGDKDRAEVLRFLLAHLQGALKDKQVQDASAELSDEETQAVIQKEAKKRRESIALFEQGKRSDLAAAERAQLAVIASYLPEQLTPEQVAGEIAKLVGEGFSDFPSLMKEASSRLKRRTDGKVIAAAARKVLG